MSQHKYIASFGAVLLAVGGLSTAYGMQAGRYSFDIPPQELKYALLSVTQQSGLQLFADTKDLQGRSSIAIRATMSPQEAFDRLLSGTGLTARIEGKAVFIRGRSVVPAANAGAETQADIVVTGSHLKGGPIASTVIRLTQDDIRNAGQTNLGDVVRDISQNFSGGQNPGVGLGVPTLSGEDVGGGTAINLRGLGQDATLTLVNGHRRAYGATRQSIDVSAIPVSAIDRIEIVPDGASAIYGSDAVAGVANVILKRDYDGISTSATLGTTTDGGGTERLAGAIAGQRWNSGGFVVAYEYGHTGSVSADDRSFARDATPDLTLIPSDDHHDVVVAGHQKLTSNLSFSLDALFNWRRANRQIAFYDDPDSPVESFPSHTATFSVSPTLAWSTFSNWVVNLQGTYGQDHIHFGSDLSAGGTVSPLQRACACNSTLGGELNATGDLLSVAGHAVQLAVGGGYRKDRLRDVTTIGSGGLTIASQSDWYGFGELDVPIIQPADDFGIVRQVRLDAAGRYESYSGIGHVATPKIGLLISLGGSIDLKSSWGKAFRAPTLYERYVTTYADIYPAALLGGSDLPANATAVLLIGGNQALKPERATTWSETVSVHPEAVKGLTIDVSYYRVRYRNRVVQPITYITNALSDPAYRPFVTFNPSSAEIAQAIEGRTLVTSLVGSFDPALVGAIVNNDLTNAAFQRVQGVDISGRYQADFSGGRTLQIDGDLSYLSSHQRTSSLQPDTLLAGTLFNPPHVRGRAGVTWAAPTFVLSGHLNYAGAVKDNRETPVVAGRSMTTVDFAGTYRFADKHDLLKGIRLTLAIDNLFNQYPGRIATPYVFEPNYDSTNYSPLGRRVSLTIVKDW